MKIFIDEGHNHSGFDTGAEGNGLKEQDITYAIGKKLSALINKTPGMAVKNSRPKNTTNLGTDVNSSLEARCVMANSWGADYFVSLHTNSSDNASARGTETYVVQKGGKAEELAIKVQDRIVDTLHTKNRGVKTANFKVLRSTNMPAILVELAFITSPSDAELLKNKQDEFAKAIYYGICAQGGFVPVDEGTANRYSYDDTVNNMVIDGVTTTDNMAYWEKVLNDNEPVNPEYLRTLLNRYHNKVK